ncbi:histone deacetylase [Microsporum canis]
MASPQQRYNQRGGRQDELHHSFNQLNITTGRSSPSHSPLQSPYHRSERSPSFPKNDPRASPTSQQQRAPRRTTSTTSLRDERRGSTPSLHKRASVSSLRSVQNLAASSSSSRQSLSRRSSAQHLASSPGASGRAISPLPEMASASPSGPSDIAAQHFAKELALHQAVDLHSRTVVIIQDACYGHRYSRPRTSKAGLELIVERPERMQASVLGLAAAYTRMGQRYGGNEFAPHPDLDLRQLPPPPFQIRKTVRTMPLNSPAVTHVHGTKWMEELRLMCDAAEGRLASNGKELVRPSSSGKETGANAAPKLHEGDLYLCPGSLDAFEGALGGVCDAVDSVFTSPSTRRAFVCIRPPGHHCSSSYPSGFCWLNNVHVGISYAAMTHGLTHAAILDFDLHHGDGSQAIAWEQNRRAASAAKNAAGYKRTAIGYFSLHDINSYPCEEGDESKVRNASVCIDNAHGQSIWNVHLESWKTTEEFWALYETKYVVLIEKARAFLRAHSHQLQSSTSPNAPQPKAAIFLSAGFDASEWEGAGMQRHKVNVSTDFYARFTADIVRMSQEEGLSVDGRVISVLEGGYSDRALISGVFSHLSGLSDLPNFDAVDDQHGSRLAAEMFNRLGLSEESKHDAMQDVKRESDTITYDTIWWAPSLLEELENLAKPSPVTPRKPRERGPPTFSAPTQASSAKVITPTRDHRSSSYNPSHAGDSSLQQLPRIGWATAAFELSKALIPTDRQTTSCQHADLKATTSQPRRDARPASAASQRSRPNERNSNHMQLRERKQKAPALPASERLRSSRSSSANTRRTTIASVNDLPDPSMLNNSEPKSSPSSRTSRRVSIASAVTPVSSTARAHQPRSRPASTRPSPSRASSSAELRNSTCKARAASSSRASTSAKNSPRKAQENDAGVDGLTASVNKLSIKLKVPSPKENALREAKLAQKDTTAASQSSRRKPAARATPGAIAPRTTKEVNGRQSRSKSRSTTATPTTETTSESPTMTKTDQFSPQAIASLDPHTMPLPEVSDAGLAHDESYVEYPTSNHEAVASTPPKESADNTSTIPSPPLTPDTPPGSANPRITVRSPPAAVPQQLPVFTATSAIPFANPQNRLSGS